VVVAQLVRALVCGTKGRGFEPRLPPTFKVLDQSRTFFFVQKLTVVQGKLALKMIIEIKEENHKND